MDNRKKDLDVEAKRSAEKMPAYKRVITFDPAIYRKNLSYIEKKNPALIPLLDTAIIDEDKIKIVVSESGLPRLLYKKEDGEEVYIHSPSDPAAMATPAIELLGKMGKEGIIVLFGFGLGYFAEAVFERFEKGHLMLIYEAKPELFKAALHLMDFSKLLESDRVHIALGEEIDSIPVVHAYYNHIINGRFWVVRHHPSIKLNEKAYDKFLKKLEDEHLAMKTNVVTGLGLGNKFIDTFLENVPSVLRKPGVTRLKNIFQGRPAIVVSAGPSLDKNIHLLKKAKGKAIIIAVEAALPTLIPCDIFPDIVVALDPLEKNIHLIKDNPFLEKITFVSLPQFTPEVVNMYPGPLLMNSLPGNIVYQWLGQFWEDKGFIECYGGSVAHFAFGAAEFIGADTIAFVGQDLSFKGKDSHTKGFTDISDNILKEAIQKKDMKDVIDETSGAFSTVDIFGEQVLTRSDFLSFKTSFEKKVREFRGTVINATEGGLSIEGAQNMRLADFIDEYCNKFETVDVFSVLSGLSDDAIAYSLEGLIASVTGGRHIFKEIKKNADRILKHAKKVKALKEKGLRDTAEFHNILNKIEPLIEKVKHPLLNIMTSYYFSLELFLIKQEIQEIDYIEDKWERLDKQLERGQKYYSEIIKAIDLFNRQLDKLIPALQREAKINAILRDEALEQKKKFVRVAEVYRKADMPAQAVKYLDLAVGIQDKTAIRMQTPDPELLIALAEMYLKQFRFYDVQELLERARVKEAGYRGLGLGVKRQKQEEKVEELLKTCDKKIKAWEQRKREMSKILEVAEKNYGGHLESGYFYFRTKDYERAEKAYLEAVSSQPTMGRTEPQSANSGSDGAAVSSKKDRGQGSGDKGRENSELPTLNSQLVQAYYGLAHTYLVQEKVESAVEALEKAIEVDPQNPLLYRDLGFIAFQSNNTEAAELFFIKALELAPQDIELYKTLVNLYVGIGDIEKATALYEDALLANPDNQAIQNDLAMLYKEIITKTGRA